MTNDRDPTPSAVFPLQRPGRFTRALFKAGTRAYCGPLARLMGAYSMLLLTTAGRRSGLPRPTALTFQPLEGRYLVLAGMGTRSDWYLNLLAEPRVRVRIGARSVAATAHPVLDPRRRRMLAPWIAARWERFGPPRAMRWMLRRFAGFDYDAELEYALAHAEDLPMVELVPTGLPAEARMPDGRLVHDPERATSEAPLSDGAGGLSHRLFPLRVVQHFAGSGQAARGASRDPGVAEGAVERCGGSQPQRAAPSRGGARP